MTGTPEPRAALVATLALIREAGHLAEALSAALNRASTAVETALHAHDTAGLAALPEAVGPINPHRAAHRAGTPAKIDNDAELQAFIRARLDRMTFVQIAAAVAEHFPPERRVGKSAIHAWFRRDVPRVRGGR